MDHNHLKSILQEQVDVHRKFADESSEVLLKIAETIAEAIRSGKKILLFGNGGSAADAQHVAAELVGRFLMDRKPLPAIALTTDTSILTAVGNDYGYENVFARQVEALTEPGDVVAGISTSGNSPNVLKALEAGRRLGAITVGFTGGSGGGMVPLCDICFIAPTDKTPRMQELHISAWHAICELVECESLKV